MGVLHFFLALILISEASSIAHQAALTVTRREWSTNLFTQFDEKRIDQMDNSQEKAVAVIMVGGPTKGLIFRFIVPVSFVFPFRLNLFFSFFCLGIPRYTIQTLVVECGQASDPSCRATHDPTPHLRVHTGYVSFFSRSFCEFDACLCFHPFSSLLIWRWLQIPNLAQIYLIGFYEEREFALYVSSVSNELKVPVR